MPIVKTKPRATLVEKMLINWATIPDACLYTLRSRLVPDRYERLSFKRYFTETWKRRTRKYETLIKIKNSRGYIPRDIRKNHLRTPCECTRLLSVYLFR